jgi:hypothetical protein
MRRAGRLLLGVVAVVLFLGTAGVGESRSGGPVLLGALAVGGLGWMAWTAVQRRRPAVPSGWSPAAQVTYRPAQRPAGPGPGSVALALSRVEARELTTSPAFGVGLGFSALGLFLFGYEWAGDHEGDLARAIELLPILAHPLAGMVVLATFRACTRARRDGVEELYGTCPTSPTTRATGHLLTGWAPAVVALVFAGAMVALIDRAHTVGFGEVGGRQVAAFLGAGVLCLGAVALGVALARWLPWTLVPVVAVVAVGVASVNLATHGTRISEPVRQLSTWLGDSELDLRLTAPHWIWHHVWILALVVVVALLAVLRDRRDPVVLVALALAVAVATGAAVAATRPIAAGDARRIATLLTDRSLQRCADAGGLDICTFSADDELRAAYATALLPVAGAAPAGALDGWSLEQLQGVPWDDLDPEVRALAGSPPARDGVIAAEVHGHPLAIEAARIWTGLAAVEVLDDWGEGSVKGLRGQARGVVALWLASRGADPEVQRLLTTVGSGSIAAHDAGRPWPDACYAGPVPVRWAATDVAAARSLIELPEAEVRAVLVDDWARWTDRSTSTDDLLEALGLAPVGVEGDTPSASEC